MAGHFFQNWSHRVVLRARKFEFSRPDRVLRSSKGSWYLDPGIWVLRPRSRYLDPGIPGWRTDFRVWEWILAVWVGFERFPGLRVDFGCQTGFWTISWVSSSFEQFWALFFIENNFWNNISARDAFPCVCLDVKRSLHRIIKKKPSIFHPIAMSRH